MLYDGNRGTSFTNHDGTALFLTPCSLQYWQVPRYETRKICNACEVDIASSVHLVEKPERRCLSADLNLGCSVTRKEFSKSLCICWLCVFKSCLLLESDFCTVINEAGSVHPG